MKKGCISIDTTFFKNTYKKYTWMITTKILIKL